jgi:hypothetical protein
VVEHHEPAHPSSRERSRRTRSGRAWLSAKSIAGVFIVGALVAADEADRRPGSTGDERIDPSLVEFALVDAHLRDDGAAIGVIEDRRRRAHARVVSDEQRDVMPVEALDHAERLERAGDELHALVELLEHEVAHVTVAIVDEHVLGPGRECSLGGRVGLGGHERSGFVVAVAAAATLLAVDASGHAFEIDGDVDPHRVMLRLSRGPGPRRHPWRSPACPRSVAARPARWPSRHRRACRR